jgi:hypothetical protein
MSKNIIMQKKKAILITTHRVSAEQYLEHMKVADWRNSIVISNGIRGTEGVPPLPYYMFLFDGYALGIELRLQGSGCEKLNLVEFETLVAPDVTKPYFSEMKHLLIKEMNDRFNDHMRKYYNENGYAFLNTGTNLQRQKKMKKNKIIFHW